MSGQCIQSIFVNEWMASILLFFIKNNANKNKLRENLTRVPEDEAAHTVGLRRIII